jgi:hypothetical protein
MWSMRSKGRDGRDRDKDRARGGGDEWDSNEKVWGCVLHPVGKGWGGWKEGCQKIGGFIISIIATISEAPKKKEKHR